MTYLLAIILGIAIGITSMALQSYNGKDDEDENESTTKTNDKCQL